MQTLLHLVLPTLQQATADPCLHLRLLDTHRQGWVSFFWGHWSFLLGPGAHKIFFVSSKSLFPHSCVSSGGSMVGLMVTSSKRAYATARSAASRASALKQATADPYFHRRHSNPQRQVWFSPCGVSCCANGFVWALWVSLVGVGFDSKCDFCPSFHLAWASSLPLDEGYLFMVGSNILLLMVVQKWVVILQFLQEKMSAYLSTLLSWSRETIMDLI